MKIFSKNTKLIMLIFASFFGAQQAIGGLLTVHVGPPSLGAGGSNPLSIPPTNIIEYEFTYVTKSEFETNIGIVPGLLFGKRSTEKGFYVGFGGGLVLSINGGGPGVYSSLGFDLGDKYKFNMEFKQAIGIDLSTSHLVSPYAIRAGMTFVL